MHWGRTLSARRGFYVRPRLLENVFFSSALRLGRRWCRAGALSVCRISLYEPIAAAIAGDPELK
jgi:hypothetical protein